MEQTEKLAAVPVDDFFRERKEERQRVQDLEQNEVSEWLPGK